MNSVFTFAVLTLLLGCANASLYLVAVNRNGYRRVTRLSGFMTICPNKSVPDGFNIQCVPNFVAPGSRASFFVNGKWERSEQRTPFFLAGDVFGTPKKWTTYPETANILCRVRHNGSRREFRATVHFNCQGGPTIMSPSPSPSTVITTPIPNSLLPNTMYFRMAEVAVRDLPRLPAVEVYDNMTFCPRREFGKPPFTVQCVGDSNTDSVRFFIREESDHIFEFVRFDGGAPYLMTSRRGENIRRLSRFPKNNFLHIRCRVSDVTLITRRVRIACQ